ncbi:TonB-dependent hemoglobin/transferrin/lactoferrin family receptor [Marichromatium sp. PS1]
MMSQSASLPRLVGCCALAALAQPLAAEPRLPTISVVATGTERAVDTLPESVSVVERDQLERNQPSTVGEVLETLPNVALGGGPRPAGQQLTIRGIGDSRLLYLIDGVRQNFSRSHSARIFVEPELLERVEVLRGPASALWGSGAIGGVVALQTREAADLLRPGQRIGGLVKTGYQDVNDEWLGAAAVYGAPTDGLDYLLNLSYREAGDVALGNGEDLDHSGYERLSGLGKLNWTPDGVNHFGLSLMGGALSGEVPSNAQIAATAEDLLDRDIQQTNLALRYRHASPDQPWFNPSLTLYRNLTDIDETRLHDGREDETEIETLGGDLRNQMHFSGEGALAQLVSYGLEWHRDSVEARRDGAPRTSYPDGEGEVLGLFLQDEIMIGERWTLIPGVRWDRYTRESDDATLEDHDDSAFSAKLGVDIAVTDWLSLQASYNEAFRAPGVSELYVSGTHFSCGRGCQNLFVPNPDLEPEKAHNKEIGIRLHRDDLFAPGDHARFQARAFRNDVDDFIDQIVQFVFYPVPGNPQRGGVTSFRNVDSARLEGFELEAGYDAGRWFANAFFARTRGEDKTSGEPLSSVQPDTWQFETGLRLPEQRVELGWRARFVAEQDRVPVDGTPADAYQLHDLWLTWRPHRDLTLDLGIDNLFDEDYLPYLSALEGPGRNLKATLSYRF